MLRKLERELSELPLFAGFLVSSGRIAVWIKDTARLLNKTPFVCM